MSALLPLDSFRKIISYNPWHFWGLANSKVPVSSSCNEVVYQYGWQYADAVGREGILAAIETAETRLREYLGYGVAPRYAAETVSIPRYHDHALWRYGNADADGRWASLRLSEGYIQAIGVEARTLIDGAVAVAYSDVDGDGLNELATISVATTVTEPTQIAVYFGSSDRLDSEDVSERWRIQPLKVSISGGIATIRGPAWIFVKPIKYEGANRAPLDPDTASNFVSTVAVYRRYTNPDGTTEDTAQAKLIWETAPYPWWGAGWCCGGTTSNATDPAAQAYAVARVGIRDATLGIVYPGAAVYDTTNSVWSSTTWAACRPPDRVTVRYLAGYPLEDQQMSQTWQTVVARLALAEMAGRICACDSANREWHRWAFDMSRAAGANDEQYSISQQDLDNPLGARAGQIYAWKQVRNLRNLVGFAPG